ncbi:hypothetical protein MJ904_01055 [Massilia sp. MB5]|uniref:HD-GYP domain-containing protein n=1 Tax=Massilia sp. MB5 TaxID=2919578 RepID=UPI001F10BEB1|nr:HD domain-containing phosphohydrolase [Massilia sp. MB5]UMR30891.1 hypothetical protein MJ904_01055 [Massilia sp. MB5]
MKISTAACPPAWVSIAECLRALAFVGDLAAARRSGPRHPSWLMVALSRSPPASGERPSGMLSLEEMADLIDLQQPWLCGHSRRVAIAAQRAASQMGFDEQMQQCCYRAGLVHAIGRGAIPSELWNVAGPLPPAVREQLRLAPYWTWRALREAGGMAQEAEIASYVGERLDGSGNFRGATGTVTPLEGQVLAAAAAWVALQAARPWRPAYSTELAGAVLARRPPPGAFIPEWSMRCKARRTVQRHPYAPQPESA